MFKQWVWVVQPLPKSIVLGMFKSEGREESNMAAWQHQP